MKRIGGAMCILAAAFLAGCTMARMAVPPDLPASASAMPVEGRKTFSFDESFHFGGYRVESVRRGWTHSTAWRFLGFESGKAKQKYEFALKAAGGTSWKAHCATGVRWKEMEFENFLDSKGTLTWPLHSDTGFACTFEGGEGAPSWKLAMEQGADDLVLNGVLTDGTAVIRVEGIRKLKGTPIPLGEPSGFLFLGPDGLVGAVEVINNGTVWIAGDVSPELQSAVACTSASLLLYRALK
ncbi:MAG TPA: hypothetical protein P5567_12525 [Kiritimatiellia bacterium]|nr:hypothetical protein [Kiritimatiellia bacterium]HRZ13266.1 hypothetical protein [Kiritimatiellia bacterium]HSA18715.1 hypothetical protein [Kiritimatiellia bacterium]